MTISGIGTVELLTDRIQEVKRELQQDIARVEGKVDEALEDLKALRNKLDA